MSKYTMAQIVTLTGIKSHTLRKWESRYNFLIPERTSTNIRYYTDLQLKKLLNIGILTRNGYRISKIDKMSDDEIHDAVSKIVLDGAPEDEVSALIVSTINLNEDDFSAVINNNILMSGLISTVTQLIYPFLAQVGLLWGTNKIMPAQEHFVSNLIRQKMFSAIELLPKPLADAPKALLFLPEHEQHEIGLLLASFIAQKLGWRVYYLGQNVPTENIVSITNITTPDLLVTMFISQVSEDRIAEQLSAYLNAVTIPIAVFGHIPSPDAITQLSAQIKYLQKPTDFIQLIQTFKSTI
ncbi:MerR family transcriptional regulator [Formosa sp. A9]|uniref:MerR family transcriptional regulator n=1 Tax=Formosa sp. A9 TaxID=3442641 RepID=UPI003EB98198